MRPPGRTRAMTDSLTIVDVFEEVLQVPFEAGHLSGLDIPTLRRLAYRLHSFFENFNIPEKADGELRPYLFHRYTTAHAMNREFWSSTSPLDIAPQIKAYLLYCHGLVFEDGLSYMLDYFRFSDDKSALKDVIPIVENLLKQYASIAPLLRHKIVIPVTIPGTPGIESYRRNTTAVDKHEIQEITAQLKKKSLYDDISQVYLLGQIVKEQWFISMNSQNAVDMYFPDEIYVDIYQGLLRALRHRFSSQTVLEPFNVGLIGSLSNIDSDKLSTQDIISVRQEGTFEVFRSFLRRSFERLHRSDNFSDFETEFVAAFREELKDNEEAIRAMTQKSGALRKIASNSDRIAIGAATGMLPGLVQGSPVSAILAAAFGGAFRPTYDILRGQNTRVSLRNHFLAIHPGKSR